MNNSNPIRLTVYTNYLTYLLIILLPVFLFLLDFLSSVISNTTFTNNFGSGLFVIFVILVIGSVKTIKVSGNFVTYWSNIVIYKKIPLKNIALINTEMESEGFGVSSSVQKNMYLLDKTSQVLGKINVKVFSKNDLEILLTSLLIINPDIKIKGYLKPLDTLSDKNINLVSNKALGVISIVFSLVFIGALIFF